MDVVNFPAILAQYGFLKPGDVVTQDDLILIGKKINNLRDGSQYRELAMTIQDFLAMAGASPNPTFCSVTMQKSASFGPLITYVHPDGVGQTQWDTVAPGVQLTRSVGGGAIWNISAEFGYSLPTSPANTAWFWVSNPGTFDYSTFQDVTYSNMGPLVSGNLPCGGFICIPGEEFIMHDIINDEYWRIKFLTWTAGGPGGFSYTREKMTLTCDGCIHFADGTKICSGNIPAPPPIIDAAYTYVDSIYGNDGTGTTGVFNKPFQTISAALVATAIGGRVHVRAGTYNETIALKDGVDIHFETGVVGNGLRFQDFGNSVICHVTGNAVLRGNSYITLNGASTVDFEFEEFLSTSGILYANPNPGNTLKTTLKAKRASSTGAFTGIAAIFISGASEVTIEVEESIRSSLGAILTAAMTSVGNLTVTCPRIIGDGFWWCLATIQDNDPAAQYTIYGDLYLEKPTPFDYQAVVFHRAGDLTIYGNLEVRPTARGIGLIIDGGFSSPGSAKIYGDIISRQDEAVFHSNPFIPLLVQGGLVMGGVSGLYKPCAIVIGWALPGLPPVTAVNEVYFKDCRIVQLGVTNNIVDLTGWNLGDDRIYCYNTEIIYDTPNPLGEVCFSSTTPRVSGFVDTNSSNILGATCTDVFAPSGFIVVTGFVVPKF